MATYVPDVDFNILMRLPDHDLTKVCQTNVYFSNLCHNENFWRRRTAVYFGDIYAQEKFEDVTWQEWYRFWRLYSSDRIGETLNLTPTQAATRIITEEDIFVEGSEFFQAIGPLLIKAFISHNQEIVKALMRIYHQLFSQYLPSDASNNLMRYDKVIAAALREGFIDEAIIFLADLQQRNNHILETEESDEIIDDIGGDYYKIIKTLGSLEMVDFYRETLPQYYSEILTLNPEETDLIFIQGLIKAGYNEKAKSKIRKYIAASQDKYPHRVLYQPLVEEAFKSGNLEILPFLDSLIPPDEDLRGWQRIFAKLALRYGYPELGIPYKDFLTRGELISALSRGDPQLTLKYLEDENITRVPEGIMTCYRPLLDYCLQHGIATSIQTKQCSREELIDFVKEKRISIYHQLQTSIYNNRYDVTLMLDSLLEIGDYTHEEEEYFWQEVIGYLHRCQLFDLVIYLLLRARQVIPDRVDDFLNEFLEKKEESDEEDRIFGNYQTKLLLEKIARLDRDMLSTVNYYDLLISIV